MASVPTASRQGRDRKGLTNRGGRFGFWSRRWWGEPRPTGCRSGFLIHHRRARSGAGDGGVKPHPTAGFQVPVIELFSNSLPIMYIQNLFSVQKIEDKQAGNCNKSNDQITFPLIPPLRVAVVIVLREPLEPAKILFHHESRFERSPIT